MIALWDSYCSCCVFMECVVYLKGQFNHLAYERRDQIEGMDDIVYKLCI